MPSTSGPSRPPPPRSPPTSSTSTGGCHGRAHRPARRSLVVLSGRCCRHLAPRWLARYFPHRGRPPPPPRHGPGGGAAGGAAGGGTWALADEAAPLASVRGCPP